VADVLLTGAGSGIGHATAERLLRDGHRVFAGAVDAAEGERVAALGGRVVPLVFDVRDEASVRDAATEVAAALGPGRLRAVLNVAGVTVNGPLADLPADRFARLLAVNLVGVHAVTRAFLPLLAQPGGRVVNVSSSSGRRTLPFAGAYSASKFGVEALSTALRMELAPLGVHVTVVAPANIDTPMAARIKEELSRPPSLAVHREPLRRFLAGTERTFADGVPVAEVADTLATAVDAPRPRRRYELHNAYLRDVVLMRALPVGLREALVRRTLGLVPAR
jgi:NAD(P)-dependent dehydrogenase (short-subunit alcohol dehydrogenase family)